MIRPCQAVGGSVRSGLSGRQDLAEHLRGLLDGGAVDVEVGEQPHLGGADGTDEDALLAARRRRRRARRVRRPRRCWSRSAPGPCRRPRRAAARARGRRPAARRGGRARGARPRRARRPGACRRPSACDVPAPRRPGRPSPASAEPIGAPSPLEKQTAIVSATAPYDDSGVPVATWAFQMRAPSTWTAAPEPVGQRPQLLEVGQRQHRPAGEVVGVLDRDRRRAHEERAHVGGVHPLDRRRGRPAPGRRPRCGWSARSAHRGPRARRAGCGRATRR